jgi:lipoprotein-anchoring transpeptidase ErfK/SrfK
MKLLHICAAVAVAGGIAVMAVGNRDNASDTDAAPQIKSIKKTVFEPSAVYATIRYNGVLYSDMEMTEPCDYLASGDKVELLKDKSTEVYYVRHGKRLGWTKAGILEIPPDPSTKTDVPTAEEIENYAKENNFQSDTEYFVFVDIARQKTYVMKYDESHNLKLEKSIVCATGKNISPTTRGFFKISDRGESFYNERLGSGAKYWVRFNGSYLFHSIALNKDGSVKDDALGVRRSDGCVRMSMEDIKWFYETVPEGTGVRVY